MMLGALSAGATQYMSLVVDSVSATAGSLNTYVIFVPIGLLGLLIRM
jgi:hypothetical protein